MLAIVLLDCAISFIILSADGLTGRKYLNVHKFTADFLICNSKVLAPIYLDLLFLTAEKLLVNVTSMLVWFIVILIFHPKPPTQPNGSSLQQPAHDFLQAGKPMDGYPHGATALIVQPSQVSSDYLQYTESAITVPIQPPYSNTNPFQTPTQPPSSDESKIQVDHHHHHHQQQQQPGQYSTPSSSTPSTATLVSQRHSQRRNGKDSPTKEHVDYPPTLTRGNGHVGVVPTEGPENAGSIQRRGLQSDRGTISEVDWASSEKTNIRRQNSNDSMWLQQTPRGSNR